MAEIDEMDKPANRFCNSSAKRTEALGLTQGLCLCYKEGL